MRRALLALCLFVFTLAPNVVFASSRAASEPLPWQAVDVVGCRPPQGGWVALAASSSPAGFELGITASPLSNRSQGGLLEVWLEPSRVLLFSMSLVGGEVGAAPHAAVVRLPLAVGVEAEIRIVANVLGVRHDLALARVSGTEDFELSTAFDIFERKSGEVEITAFQHCCSGPRCSRMCVSCKGPGFSCDLIECSIECDSNHGGI